MVRATRRGFLPAEYGQRQWNSAGTPIIVDKDAASSVSLRMFRFGAITGTVRDENEVGIPEQDVAAYTNTEPPHFVTRGRSDDRGVFRIGGLDPGSYLVRTTGNEDEELSLLPTFSRQTLRVSEARPVEVYVDYDARDADVRPIRGTLFNLSGAAAPLPDPQNFAVTVTLASDLGRRTFDGAVFRFTSLAPGPYEIYVEARENPPGTRIYGGYTDFRLDRNTANLNVLLSQIRETQFNFPGAAGHIIGRRKDLAGVGPAQQLLLSPTNRALLGPGRWELAAIPPPGYYASAFYPAARGARPEGWNEILVPRAGQITVVLSGGVSALHGVVKQSGSLVSWAPVFLEEWDPVERTRLVDLRATRADVRGNYRFEGITPGAYRVLSTTEYAAPDVKAMDLAGAQSVDVGSHTDIQTDLELDGAPVVLSRDTRLQSRWFSTRGRGHQPLKFSELNHPNRTNTALRTAVLRGHILNSHRERLLRSTGKVEHRIAIVLEGNLIRVLQVERKGLRPHHNHETRHTPAAIERLGGALHTHGFLARLRSNNIGFTSRGSPKRGAFRRVRGGLRRLNHSNPHRSLRSRFALIEIADQFIGPARLVVSAVPLPCAHSVLTGHGQIAQLQCSIRHPIEDHSSAVGGQITQLHERRKRPFIILRVQFNKPQFQPRVDVIGPRLQRPQQRRNNLVVRLIRGAFHVREVITHLRIFLAGRKSLFEILTRGIVVSVLPRHVAERPRNLRLIGVLLAELFISSLCLVGLVHGGEQVRLNQIGIELRNRRNVGFFLRFRELHRKQNAEELVSGQVVFEVRIDLRSRAPVNRLRGLVERLALQHRIHEFGKLRLVFAREIQHVDQRPALRIENPGAFFFVVHGRLLVHAGKSVETEPFLLLQRQHMSGNEIAQGCLPADRPDRGIDIRPPFVQPQRKLELALVDDQMHVFVNGRGKMLLFGILHHDIVAALAGREVSEGNLIRREGLVLLF